MKKKKPIWLILFVLFLLLLICGAVVLVIQKNDKKTANDAYEQMQEAVNDIPDKDDIAISTETETEEDALAGIEIPEKNLDWDALREENQDIYAWIYVPNTTVDYPVLQSQEDNYYLTHDSNHAESVSGAIYSNACNSVDMSDRITILYGHDMRADTMFGSLHLFDEEELFEQHTDMSVETAHAYYTYEIIGVYNYNDDYLPSQFDVKTEAGMYAFADALAECQAQGSSITHVREGVQITSDDRLLV